MYKCCIGSTVSEDFNNSDEVINEMFQLELLKKVSGDDTPGQHIEQKIHQLYADQIFVGEPMDDKMDVMKDEMEAPAFVEEEQPVTVTVPMTEMTQVHLQIQ